MTGDALPPIPVLPVRRLVLWRHGRTEWNATGRFQGWLDPPLDEAGRAQAMRAAPHLAAALTASRTVVVSSDLGRAADTAAALTALLGIPLLQDPRLREHGMGCWEGLTRDEVATQYPGQYADWIAGRPVEGRGGEDPADVGERALAALTGLPAADAAVVVSHGGTVGRLIERLLNLGPDQRRVFGPLTNCAWSELVVQGSRWRLMRHNVTAPADGRVEPTPAGSPAGFSRDARPDAGASPEEGGAASVGDADAVL